MRIISGEFKGRVFTPPAKFDLRPTTDLAKEGLFNFLANRWEFADLDVLDLFAGIGNISIEFISRGIKNITAVEINAKHASFIRETAEKLNNESLTVIQTDAFDFVKKTEKQYNIVFADPPYNLEGIETLPSAIFDGGFLKPSGEFILEHSDKKDFSNHPNYIGTKKYGAVHFSIFENEE